MERNETHPTLRLLIVDDHPAVRKGLRVLLESEGIAICAEAENVSKALLLLNDYQPDIVLVDLSLGNENGLALLRELRDKGVRSLVYSMHEDSRHVACAFASGAWGYVMKSEVSGILIEAVHEVSQNKRFVSPKAAVALAEYAANDPSVQHANRLSEQEQKIFELLGQGHLIKEIAWAMSISTRTVESYCSRIISKLGVSGMKELRRCAEDSNRNHIG